MKLLTAFTLLASISQGLCGPIAYWAFDGATVVERLQESRGQSSLDIVEIGGSSIWDTRTGFGNVLANGTGTQYLQVTKQNAIEPGTGEFSISLWAYRTSNNSGIKGLLDALGSSAGSGYQLFYQSDNTIRIRLDDNSGHTVNVDTPASHYTADTWQNIIVTVDRSSNKARIYVNGSEATQTGGVDISVLTSDIIPDQDLWLGSLNGTNAARGRLDDIGLFNHVLTTAEIAAIHANGGTPLSEVFPVIPSVTINPASGALKPGETVSLTTESSVDAIYYTTDGSIPDTNSTSYTGAFTPATSGELKAVAYKNGSAGQVRSGYFSLIPQSLPNIIVIVGDDIGYGDLSCYGAPTIYTPNLDALARTGTRFTQFTTTGPGDLANQYALLTGRVARRGNVPEFLDSGDTNGLDAREWILSEALRKLDYQTAFIGAWHLGDTSGKEPTSQGFQLFYGLPYRADATPAPPLKENETTLESPFTTSTLLSQLTQRATSFISAQTTEPFFMVFQPPSLPASGTSLSGSHGDRVEALDSAVGEIRTALDNAGQTSNTLIIFVSDGGPDLTPTSGSLGSSGLFTDGQSTTWEGGIRVSAIANWPSVIPAGVDNFAVTWMPDLFPSLVEMTGAYQPDDRPYDGVARPEVWLAGRSSPDADTKVYYHRFVGGSYQLQAVREGAWKYHLSYNNSASWNGTSITAPLLYQIEVDPAEHVNRSGSAGYTSNLADLQQATTDYEATFAAPVMQLPAAKVAFLSPPEVSIDPDAGTKGVYQSSFTRPLDSLNDHYKIEYSTNLTSWTKLGIDDSITGTSAASGDYETISLSLDLDAPEFSLPHLFFRLSATRPQP